MGTVLVPGNVSSSVFSFRKTEKCRVSGNAIDHRQTRDEPQAVFSIFDLTVSVGWDQSFLLACVEKIYTSMDSKRAENSAP